MHLKINICIDFACRYTPQKHSCRMRNASERLHSFYWLNTVVDGRRESRGKLRERAHQRRGARAPAGGPGQAAGPPQIQLLALPQLDSIQRTLKILDVRLQHVQNNVNNDNKERTHSFSTTAHSPYHTVHKSLRVGAACLHLQASLCWNSPRTTPVPHCIMGMEDGPNRHAVGDSAPRKVERE